MVCRRTCQAGRSVWGNATGYRNTAGALACAVLLAFNAPASGGTLSNFETGTTEGWTVDAGAGAVTLTPDNTTSSQGNFSLRVDVATGGFHFGVMRYDQGAVNPHHPNWLPPNTTLLFDVREGTFTDFMTVRPSYIPSGPTGTGGTVNGPDFNVHTPPGWKTLAWTYPGPGSGQEVPAVPPFWIEWFSSNSNGPHSFWVDNIRTVPEPAGLLALPALGGMLVRRRRP